MERNEQRLTHVFNDLAERLVPDSADLRPAVRARLAASARGAALNPSSRWRVTRAVVALLALALAISMPLTIVAATGGIRERLQRFGLVLVDPTPLAAPSSTGIAATAPATGAAPPAGSQPWLTLDEARRRAPFPIGVPTWLPPGLTLRGAIVGAGGSADGRPAPTVVILAYAATDNAAKGLHLDQRAGAGGGGVAVPAGQERAASVGGHPATYVQGAWRFDGTWDPTADSGILSWEAGGVTCLLQFSGLGLTREDLIRIAESVR